MADLKLAEVLYKTNETINMEEAYIIVTKYPVALLKSTTHKFYYAALAARICHLLHKKEEAIHFAKTAIALTAILSPATGRQKPTTAGKQVLNTLKILEEITGG